MAARERLDLGATAITNRDGALIYSGGDMAIGSVLDENRQATARADTLHNISARVEADNDLRLGVRQVVNRDDHLVVDEVQVDSLGVVEYEG